VGLLEGGCCTFNKKSQVGGVWCCLVVGWPQEKRLWAEFSSNFVEITREKSVVMLLIGVVNRPPLSRRGMRKKEEQMPTKFRVFCFFRGKKDCGPSYASILIK
jgi:hypothetical protein